MQMMLDSGTATEQLYTESVQIFVLVSITVGWRGDPVDSAAEFRSDVSVARGRYDK
jgi:hypothetical protein